MNSELSEESAYIGIFTQNCFANDSVVKEKKCYRH